MVAASDITVEMAPRREFLGNKKVRQQRRARAR